jgi:uncharacterized protein
VSVYYADTSAIIKYYSPEKGSPWMAGMVDAPTNTIVLAEITLAEVAATIAAKTRASTISNISERDRNLSRFLQDCTDTYSLVSITRPIIDVAVALTQKYRLRGYDAVQLATALDLAKTLQAQQLPRPTFVTGDLDLITAAAQEGLASENPNDR